MILTANNGFYVLSLVGGGLFRVDGIIFVKYSVLL